ncbi:hypothetical protein BDW02DRAFT_581252 [Decorospora gaudefroyi]|uniref:Uncharacterized protein n=1 Tax=Decorospora gaudefroyi TaxID=184978 RepID=A0A6A5KBW0_9PLEO|nr:hypothetical protein BDW02DRAFT_581252 [Decorospora gaudefroyi]
MSFARPNGEGVRFCLECQWLSASNALYLVTTEYYKLHSDDMSANSTSMFVASPRNPLWSKEAILALVAIFVMVILSSIGVFCKHRSKYWKLVCFQSRRQKSHLDDEELATIRPKTCWNDIEDVRRYQQESYTSILRLRRGPRISRTSSRTLRGRR